MDSIRKVLCDFDGTITDFDVTDTILERFARPEWVKLEERWLNGEIAAKECMARQIALINAERDELHECIDAVPVTPGFVEFARFCQENELPLKVVSDGIDYVIHRVLARCGLSGIPVTANRLLINGSRFELEFPYTREGCSGGVCKCAVAGESVDKVIFIGDSHSDICISGKAFAVFARQGLPLEKYCLENGIEYTPFKEFQTVLTGIKKLVG